MTDATQKDNVLHLTNADFDKTLQDAGDKPILVDFYADWCGPCRMAAPVIEKIADDYEGKALVAKVDVDAEGELARKYGVMSIPTVMVFKGGQKVGTRVGFAGEEGYTSMINDAIKS